MKSKELVLHLARWCLGRSVVKVTEQVQGCVAVRGEVLGALSRKSQLMMMMVAVSVPGQDVLQGWNEWTPFPGSWG